jgi:hypothetical protein
MKMAKKDTKINYILKGVNTNTIQFSCLLDGQYKSKNGDFVRVPKDDYKQELKHNDKLEHRAEIVINNKLPDGSINPTIREIKNIIIELWKEHKIPKTGISCFRDGDKKSKELESNEKNGDRLLGTYFLKVHSKYDIKFYDKYVRQYKPEEDAELDGKYCNAVLQFKNYDNGTNIGVTCFITKIQVFDQNPAFEFDISAEDAFDAVQFGEDEKEEVLQKAVDSKTTKLPTCEDLLHGLPLDDDDDDSPFN